MLDRWPESRCQVVDSYRYASQAFHKVASNGYIGMVKMLPQLYRYIYDQAERATKVSAFKNWLHHYTAVNLRQLVEGFAPDVVVCTHAFPCGVMSAYKREYPDAPAIVGVVTDFVVHPFWIHDNIDAYAVGTAAMRQTLMVHGVPPERVRLTGIPIDARFTQPLDKRATREAIGIETDRTTLLLMGGGLGIGPLENALLAIDRLAMSHELQTVVVVGKNAALQKRLVEVANMLAHPVSVLGFVPNVYDYMRAADILISKPGGLTSSEALASELPLLMLRPLPGQEERNTRHLQDKGVGLRVQNSKELTQALERLLGDPRLLARMRRSARNLARPRAAQAVVDMIDNLTPSKISSLKAASRST